MVIEWQVAILIIVAALFVLLTIGVPMAFALGAVGFLGVWVMGSFHDAIQAVSIIFYSVPMNFLFLAIPLFIFMAEIIKSDFAHPYEPLTIYSKASMLYNGGICNLSWQG